ncbi:DNA-binding transcriptional LysR family regulator [Amycolatopsis bartoniae]|uniref:LysR family transcriptional regulator n=1 Tax=Amycolatopsis bartoniae TaxID=941986 RepID=A0A8H9IV75_9PSEU|nr:LysR family transcriptional regulator [Amycolatopsis bartoniae]MBB2938272.1 DNA-binding transcriptional LysR family regulator [Amycolatopsis bartoniae]TVT09044.1 LysR family transcriptional regulator [Amycolatopsis bartoniae]GHF33939.1 LysR family transcriptional regulator [Amycolatopsis bartoniae]
MELRQLEYFVAVAEERNFTRAAERVHVAQPGVSAQIRRLERELGQELLDRSGRGVRLTDAGSAVLPYARAALAAVAGARAAVDELTGLLRGRVAVGMVTSHNVDLPGLLAAFHRDHPGVEVTLTEAGSAQLVEGLRDGTLDAALVSAGPEPPPGLGFVVVTDEAITAAVAPDHELAGLAEIPLAELRDRPLISLPPGTGIRSHLEHACAAAGFRPRIVCEAGDPSVLAQFAAHGLGVAILPDSLARSRPGLHPLAIVAPRLRGRLVFAWRTDGPVSPAARALLDRARSLLDG